MRVCIPLCKGDSDIHNTWNPYVYTITDCISGSYSDIEFSFNADIFTTNEIFAFDIIHIMWPNIFFFMENASKYGHRLKEIKKEGIKIVSTCHNLAPHYSNEDYKKDFYRITYEESDLIIHLGQYSKEIFEKELPEINHLIIPHHVYDTVYTNLQKMQKGTRRYITCIGAFRDQEEIDLLKCAGKSLTFSHFFFLVPSLLINIQRNRRNKLALLWTVLKRYWLITRYHIVTLDKQWVNHEDLSKYLNHSCITFIQRKVNLNSGNLALGFLFGNVVVGPSIGNIGRILHNTGNPTFNPDEPNTIGKAIREAVRLLKEEKGKENQAYALCHWTTQKIADMHYNVYKSLKQEKRSS